MNPLYKMAEDDIWASDEDSDQVSYDQMIAQREWEKMNEVHGNEGYKDGIVAGKDITIQEGFNKGYKEGVALGRQFGKLRGIASTLLVYYTQVQKDVLDSALIEKLIQLHNELSTLGVEDLYTKDYFREPANDVQKESEQCCGQGGCPSSEPSNDVQPNDGCCKNHDSKSTCHSADASKSVDPATVVASYQNRVEQLISQLPLPQSKIIM
ncbi:hypothetical protein BGW37DRAFT_497558 [Umbelopsis sp. PMI_123]|nr:hypothetical protein BGW37DRAFT_497558 [Umbelopsis sp. PMI_123]